MPENEVQFCKCAKVQYQGQACGQRSAVGQWSKATGYPWDSNVLTPVHESHRRSLFVKHWLVNIDTGHSCRHVCHVNCCNLTPNSSIKDWGRELSGSNYFLRSGLSSCCPHSWSLSCICLFAYLLHCMWPPLIACSCHFGLLKVYFQLCFIYIKWKLCILFGMCNFFWYFLGWIYVIKFGMSKIKGMHLVRALHLRQMISKQEIAIYLRTWTGILSSFIETT